MKSNDSPLRSYRNRFRLLVVLVILAVIGWAVVVFYIFGRENPPEGVKNEPESVLIRDNTLVGISPIYIPYVETYGSIIDKLARCESTNNPEAINWNDNGSPSYGLLQFKSGTFQEYCVSKYGLPDDIMDGEIQRECADYMIRDGLLDRWTCSLTI
jgi:hypothetical protein